MANRDLLTRSGVAAALSQAQHDQNINSMSHTVEAQTGSTYTVVFTDQNKVIELNNASMTCTMDAATNISTSGDTDGFIVTLVNTNAAAATIARTGTDTFSGQTSLTLAQYDAVTLSLNSGGTGYDIAAYYNTGYASLTGTETLTNKTLTDPSINDYTITDTSTGVILTGALDDDTMAADSANAIATQQSIKAYVDNKLIILDTPVEIATLSSTGAGSWTLVDMSSAYAAAATAVATKAVLNVRVRGTASSGVLPMAQIVYLRKTGSGSAQAYPNAYLVNYAPDTGVSTDTHEELESGVIVNLDSNSDFDFLLLSNNSSTYELHIYIAGYYV